ncbi:MAG: hypothetical protein J6M18_06530 [Actinomycetaceae bacterium]|nr:hypothetical protein [Actinomycetaceae bacterium]
MHIIIIGTHLSALISALMLADADIDVTIISTQELNNRYIPHGTLDIIDAPAPLQAIEKLNNGHPYKKAGINALRRGIDFFNSLIHTEGNLEKTTLFPTAMGSLRRSSFYSPLMQNGATDRAQNYFLVSPVSFRDFYPGLAAENLINGGFQARSARLQIQAPAGDNALAFSQYLRMPGKAEDLGRLINMRTQPREHVGLPAICDNATFERIQKELHHPLFLIPTSSPSLIGMEWARQLIAECANADIPVWDNIKIHQIHTNNNAIDAITIKEGQQTHKLECDGVIYAGGGFDTGALSRTPDGILTDSLFHLPIYGPDGTSTVIDDGDLLNNMYSGTTQSILSCGLGIDSSMHVLNENSQPAYTNLFAAGSMVAGASRTTERSSEGISLSTAAKAVESILQIKETLQ